MVEHSAEKMFTAEQGAKLARSRQALEAVRGDRAIEQLSADLASFLRRLDMARTAPRRARNPIEREWLEQEFAAKLPDWAEEQALILGNLFYIRLLICIIWLFKFLFGAHLATL